MLSILSTETVLETDRGAGASWTGLQWDGEPWKLRVPGGGQREPLHGGQAGQDLETFWSSHGVLQY